MPRIDKWDPNPFVGREGSKVSRRKLTFGQKAFIATVALIVVGLCIGVGFAGRAQCCPPPTTIIREVPIVVTETVVIEKEPLPCANQNFEVGFSMFGPDTMLLAANLDWRPKLGNLNIGDNGWIGLDMAIGLSGGAIGDQPIFGVNAKFGVSFADPGPYFDIARFIWFPQWTNGLYYEEVGLRIPVLGAPIGQMSALLYLGAERFVHLSQLLGYVESNTLLIGGTARICRSGFSFGFQTEIRASYQTHDCENYGLVWGLGLNIFLWF
ncbi:hypothetical protein KJ562_02740 [Patescibacteria group bacterium]|nr:hypothetical protein [Patescibacteria group bacterium]MBU4162204.1 hypothetical protein [Patescibacteria group bacterium]